MDKAGGWGNRPLTAQDFENHNQQQQVDRRGGYQQGRGQGRGGYQRGGFRGGRGGGGGGGYHQQPQRGGRGRGGYQQQHNWHQHQSISNNQTSWNTQSTSNQSSDNTSWDQRPASTSSWDTSPSDNATATLSSWDQKPSEHQSSWDQKPHAAVTTPPPSGWDAKPTSTTSAWDTKPASSSWAAQATELPTPAPKPQPAVVTTEQQEEDGWNTPAKSDNSGQWGAMTMDSLGWTDSSKKPKDTIEPGQGIWKDGIHQPGQESEEVKLKLFGTATDHESVHSGINFDKYENIPVETKGENVPEGITEVGFKYMCVCVHAETHRTSPSSPTLVLINTCWKTSSMLVTPHRHQFKSILSLSSCNSTI